mgnify:FL=1
MNFMGKLLSFYNMTNDDYNELSAEASYDKLPSPTLFKDVDKCVNRITSAIENNEDILIYGDYDVDGIMSTTIMVKALRDLKAKVKYYLPSRYKDGYGLNTKMVEVAHKKGYKLIITVDNGVAQHDAIKRAYELGIDVIITDHHEITRQIPENIVGIMHPIYSGYGNVYCCGAYVAYMLAVSLLSKHYDFRASLAGIATISDMMELKNYNREIVKIAINNINKYKYEALMLLCDKSIVDELTISLKIAPKLNSIGRLMEDYSINKLVESLLCDDIDILQKTATWIEQCNNERKILTNSVCESLTYNIDAPAIICITETKEGIIGLIANKLMQENNKPTIVFTESTEDDKLLKGSARSKNGFSISESFEKLNDLLLAYGGHASAGGLTINKDSLNEFVIRFNELAKKSKLVDDYLNSKAIEIDINEINVQNYELLSKLKPFGIGFEQPVFKINNLKCSALTFTKTREHILYQLSMNTKIIGFNIPESSLLNIQYINTYGVFSLESFRGHATVTYKIEKYEISTK